MVTYNRDYVFQVSKGKGKVNVECEMCLEKVSSGFYRKLKEKKNNLFLNYMKKISHCNKIHTDILCNELTK